MQRSMAAERRRVKALDDVVFVEKGEFALIRQSGSGKSSIYLFIGGGVDFPTWERSPLTVQIFII